MTEPKPTALRFDVLPKACVWGGTLLFDRFGKPRPPGGQPCGETWEIVDLPENQSIVSTGPLKGRSLAELVRDHPHWLMGKADLLEGRFPLLLKLIDAHQTLSVQVHPGRRAAERLGGRPKTEAWVILDAAEGGSLFLGLKPGVTQEALLKALTGPSLEHLLNRVSVRPGDVVFIPSGTVHAIGAGVLLAELQQASDTTYRLHDWGRVGLDGRPRPLHVDQALRSIDFTPEGLNPWKLTHGPGRAVDDEAFVMEVHRLEPDRPVRFDHDRPIIAMGLDGRFLAEAGGQTQPVAAGQATLIPAQARCTVLTAGSGPSTALVGWPG